MVDRTRVTLLVCALAVLAAVGVVGLAAPGAASVAPDVGSESATSDVTDVEVVNATVTAERVGTNRVEIRVELEEARNATNLTVRVAATGEAQTETFQPRDNGSVLVNTMRVTALTSDNGTTNLPDATLEVSAGNETYGSASANLQYATLSDASEGFVDGELHVDGVSLRGYEPGSEVRVTLGETNVSAQYRANDSELLVLDRSSLAALSSPDVFGDRLLVVNPSDAPSGVNVTASSTRVDVQRAAADASTLVVDGTTLAVRNPLVGVLDENQFVVDVRTTSPDGRYVDRVSPDGTRLALPTDVLGAEVNLTLSTTGPNRNVLLRDWSDGYGTDTVDVGVNGTYVTVPSNVSASALLYEADDEVTRVPLEFVDGTTYATVGNVSVPPGRSVVVVGEERVRPGSTNLAVIPAALNAADGNGTAGNGTTENGNATAGVFGGGFDPVTYTVGQLALVVGLSLLLSAMATLVVGVVRWFNRSPLRGYRPTDRAGFAITVGIGLGFGLLGSLVAISMNAPVLTAGVLPGVALGLVFGPVGSWPTAYAMASVGVWGEASGGGPTGHTVPTVSVEVELVTENNRKVNEQVAVGLQAQGRNGTAKTTRTGRATFEVKPDTWTAVASLGDREWSTTVEVDPQDSRGKRVKLTCPRPTVGLRLTDDADGEPIPDATVVVDPDAADVEEATSGRDGRASVTLPYAVTSASISVEHPKYTRVTRDVSLEDAERTFGVSLQQKTGTLSVTAKVDGVATAGLPVKLAPVQSDEFRARERRESLETGRDGTTNTDLIVGEYVVGLDLPAAQSSQFDTETSTVTIREGSRASVAVHASFDWTLPSSTRSRLAEVRSDVQALSDRAGRDVAFPRYYGSVIAPLLDLVESLPENGHLFLGTDESADAIAEALLNAADTGVSRVNTAMTTKRNVDMFAACADMRDVATEWNGTTVSTEAFFERLDGRNDGDLTRRIEEVKERIDRERGQLTEVEPATEMWEHTRELFQEARRERDELDRAAKALLVAALLDAIEGTFERDPLRERMKQTVF